MDKKLIAFDLDGTLAESKSNMDSEMVALFSKLVSRKKVAVISGGAYKQFMEQFLVHLDCPPESLKNLYLFPTCGTSFYHYKDSWQKVYREELLPHEKERIIESFSKAFQDIGFVPLKKSYGQLTEDRGTQITFSALGQQAPRELKEEWDPGYKKRLEIKKALEKYIPEFEIRIGGTTSLDITRKGIDKAYAIKQIEKHLSILKEDILFVGDALFQGGNDYPVKQVGVDCIEVSGPGETKKVIRSMVG